jgi:hypothetical protein
MYPLKNVCDFNFFALLEIRFSDFKYRFKLHLFNLILIIKLHALLIV